MYGPKHSELTEAEMNRPAVLFIDDDYFGLMSDYPKALHDAGFRVVKALNRDEAIRKLYTAGHRLIILDRQLGPKTGNPHQRVGPDDRAGDEVLERVKSVPGLRGVPVLMLTLHTEPRLEDPPYDRVTWLPKTSRKGSDPAEVAKAAIELIAHHNYCTTLPQPAMKSDVNLVPYYVWDEEKKAPCRVFFQACTEEELRAILREHPWAYHEHFAKYSSTSIECIYRLLAEVPSSYNDKWDDVSGPTLGLYFSGDPNRLPDWETSYFETAPELKRGVENRPLRGFGRVFLARLLRERLGRVEGGSDAPLSFTKSWVDSRENPDFARGFLLGHGFDNVEGGDYDGGVSIDQETARGLIERACQRGPFTRVFSRTIKSGCDG